MLLSVFRRASTRTPTDGFDADRRSRLVGLATRSANVILVVALVRLAAAGPPAKPNRNCRPAGAVLFDEPSRHALDVIELHLDAPVDLDANEVHCFDNPLAKGCH